MDSFGNMDVDYLRAAARKATTGKTATFTLAGPACQILTTWSTTTSEGSGHGQASPVLKIPVQSHNMGPTALFSARTYHGPQSTATLLGPANLC